MNGVEAINLLKKKVTGNISKFMIYNKNSNTIKFPRLKINTYIVPVCIKYEFYSHMTILVKKNANVFIYYDPNNEHCDQRIIEYFQNKNFKIVQYYNRGIKSFECVKNCVDFIIHFNNEI